jgi:hypothetical protein
VELLEGEGAFSLLRSLHEQAKSSARRQRPRQDSNLRTRFRRPVLYPLSYGGGARNPKGLAHFADRSANRRKVGDLLPSARPT